MLSAIEQGITLATQLKPGIYQHYKGNEYQVYEVATHSETEENLVIYRPLYGEGALWARPLAMWSEPVQWQGQTLPRFQFLREA
jgi:hypothetical protein